MREGEGKAVPTLDNSVGPTLPAPQEEVLIQMVTQGFVQVYMFYLTSGGGRSRQLLGQPAYLRHLPPPVNPGSRGEGAE